MPHAIVEYSKNLGSDADIPGLLQLIASRYRGSGGVFPVGGVRVRAIGYDDYVVADGDPACAFVQITCRIAAGRPEDVRKAFFDSLFEAVKAHFAVLQARIPLAIAMEIEQVDEDASYKHNSIHPYLKAKASHVA